MLYVGVLPDVLLTTCNYSFSPSSSSSSNSLYGIQSANSGWVVIRVNFTNSFDRVCTPSDYYTWTPYDAVSN